MTGDLDDGQLRVVPADPQRCDALASLMAEAFDDDPVSTWLFPDSGSRKAVQRRFFTPFLDLAFRDGEVHTVDAGDGVALWLPVDPARPDDPADAAAFEEELEEALGEHAERFAVLGELMDGAHPAHERHHYLPFIAVDPGRQGIGIGTQLLADRLRDLDATGSASYLESSCPRNQRLYERLGYREIGTSIRLPDGPELVPMWRSPGGP